MRAECRRRHTKNPAKAGFFCIAGSQAAGNAPTGRLRGLDGLDARGQAALVACSLVLVDQAAGAETVEDGLSNGESSFGACSIVGVKGLDHLLDGGAQHRALTGVALIAHNGLLGALLGGLDIGHGGGFLKNRYGGKSKRESMMDPDMYVKSVVKRDAA
ncbi:conserved hypothetical protein [Xanthomonas citri pv. citri]|nr:conserved hypothetical protein [Xanthomonas citri pv. citri]